MIVRVYMSYGMHAHTAWTLVQLGGGGGGGGDTVCWRHDPGEGGFLLTHCASLLILTQVPAGRFWCVAQVCSKCSTVTGEMPKSHTAQ